MALPPPRDRVATYGFGPARGDRHTQNDELTALRAALEARAGELSRYLGVPCAGAADPLELIRQHVAGPTVADAIGWARRDFLGWGRA